MTTAKMIRNSGYEGVELTGGPGYEDEHLKLENSLSNGVRFLVWESPSADGDGTDVAHFHIRSKELARVLARKLVEFSERNADPPSEAASDMLEFVDS